ncbi:hypothetical protein EON67_05550 [archaeon]|nr:MAG: hypothetical protein EON67_05550 [archaeon]
MQAESAAAAAAAAASTYPACRRRFSLWFDANQQKSCIQFEEGDSRQLVHKQVRDWHEGYEFLFATRDGGAACQFAELSTYAATPRALQRRTRACTRSSS